jgi:2-keto-3-deoxy-L-rhamnonate aldolase RhmA
VGAAGIIAPMINSAKQAEQVVRWAKYAPLGTRGVGVGRAHGYGFAFQEYVSRANEETVVVVQAEHIDAVNNIEAIVHVPGVDVVLVGPYDLSASLGRLGEVTHPEVVSAIEHVTRVCWAAHRPLGIFGMTAEAVKPYIERGYTLIAVSTDMVLLGNAARQMLAQLKA